MTKYTRDELLMLKEKFIEKPMHFESIYKIFNKNSIVSKFWKPNSDITSEQEKIKKNSFNILNKLSLKNFSNLTNSLISLLQETNDDMIKMFIKQMINKCANEKRYISLYVELYTVLKDHINYFYEYFLETLQEMYESFEGNKTYHLGLLTLIMTMYNKGIIKEYIIHQCLKQYFEKKMFEEICILFSTCGKNLDHERAKKFNKVKYFLVLEAEKENKENGMRVCFKIQDLLNLYQNNWVRI
jgi:hypothetical protein